MHERWTIKLLPKDETDYKNVVNLVKNFIIHQLSETTDKNSCEYEYMFKYMGILCDCLSSIEISKKDMMRGEKLIKNFLNSKNWTLNF